MLNTVTNIDNEINSTTDKTTLDNLQERKTAILNQIDDLNSQIASKQSEIERLQARVEELENSVQINVTNAGETNAYAGLITEELANLLENATDEELHNYSSDSNIVWNNVFIIGNSVIEESSNISFKILKNLNGSAIFQNSGRNVDFNCNYGSFNGYEMLSNYGYFNSDDEGATFKRELTNIELNLTYKLENGTIIDINSYDDKTTLKSYRCENVNVTYDDNHKVTAFTGDIVILSMVEPMLYDGRTLRTNIGADVTAVTFDYYTDSVQKTYIVDGVNVIDGIEPINVSNANNEYGVKLYMVDNKAYILSRDKIVANSDMSNIFENCSLLTDLNLNNLDTSKVTNMCAMFSGCNNLTNLNLSNFDTRNVTLMRGMFSDCSSLVNLDLSSFDTSNVVYMSNMFRGCHSLTTIYVGDNWNVDNVTSSDYMFVDCINLPNFDGSVVDKTNAYIGGYLTSKTQSAENRN